MLKQLFAFTLLCLITSVSFAQWHKPVASSPGFSAALEKIVLDFRNNFRNIQGDVLQKEGETEIYESAVKLPGAVDCKIIRFHSALDTTASWQATLYKGEEYNEAINAYQNTFNFVKKSRLRWVDGSNVSFSGSIQPARNDVRFTVSTLQLLQDDERYKNFEAQVELVSNLDGWEVHVNLHKKIMIE